MASSLRDSFQPKLILPSLSIGVVFGVRNAVVCVAYALMIFSGDLSSALSIGITVLLIGGCIHALVTSLGSSLPGILSGVQDSPSVIMAVVITSLLASMPNASPETKLYTALAAIMITTLLTGLVCLLLGIFKLGSLVSYIPYPVVGGFLGGTGVLLILGALKVMIGKTVTLFTLGQLFDANAWLHWVTGVAFGIILFVLVKKINHYLVLPSMLVVAVTIFYLMLSFKGISVLTASQSGWLVSGTSQTGALFHFWNPAGFTLVNWNALFDQAGSLLACVAVSLISMLLNTTALELSTGHEVDLNTELRSNGWANILAGAAASTGGYPMLGNTTLAYRMGAQSHLNGIFIAAVILSIMAFGGGLLGYFPNLILGGLLFFVGMDFLYSWLYQTWFSMPRTDYAILILIALLINLLGFLQGVGIGLALAVVMFVFQYSRTHAIRHVLTGISYQSSVERASLSANLLKHHGDWLYILELQGFIFFGTATQILDQIHSYLNDLNGSKPPRFIILDFRLVTGLDSSAAFSFAKIKRLAQERDIILVLTNSTSKMQKQLKKDLPADKFRYFPDMDRGIEWCENQMISSFENTGVNIGESYLFRQLRTKLTKAQISTLKQYLKPVEFQAGERIISQGDQHSGLYMIESGQVAVQIECDDGSALRLRTLGPGAFFGEMALYSGEPVSADVIAEEKTGLHVLSGENLAKLEESDHVIATALHRFVITYMSERLSKLTSTVQALR